MKGSEKNGEYKITVPQNDFNIIVDGFKIYSANGLDKMIDELRGKYRISKKDGGKLMDRFEDILGKLSLFQL